MSPEALEQLSAGMDSDAHELLESLPASWLSHDSTEKHKTTGTSATKCDAMSSDPLALSINMISTLSRAAFISQKPGSSPTASSEEQSLLQRTLYLYKLSAIAIIRQKLSDASSINDPNVFQGIITLAGCEFMAGSPAEGRLHLEACLEIARARGGLDTLLNSELESLSLTDFSTAALSGNLPIVSVGEIEAAIQARRPKPRNSASLVESGFSKLQCLLTKQALQLREGLINLFYTTTEINQAASRSPKSQEYKDFHLRGLLAGYQLCHGQQPDAKNSSANAMEARLCESLRIAGTLLVAIACLKEIPREHLFERLTEDLMLRMQHITASYLPRPAIPAMLWVCFIGAYCASTSAKQAFFLQYISQLASFLDLEKWKYVREQLRRFPYLDSVFNAPFDEIWNSAAFWSGSMEWE
ncbi:hypothetical protein H2200_009885 [Cladophialophora chaetospira]|uniref:Uncharacterized protein n=1 Tax=Cladophialophora chaetospira TaxID=386627 RepID=A0AA39CF74_9EURO|nr:hypothetical protein H2200_009885 [Cladophialophora chaetospira]